MLLLAFTPLAFTGEHTSDYHDIGDVVLSVYRSQPSHFPSLTLAVDNELVKLSSLGAEDEVYSRLLAQVSYPRTRLDHLSSVQGKLRKLVTCLVRIGHTSRCIDETV